MKNLILWGLAGYAIYCYNAKHSHNADVDAESHARSIVQTEDSQREQRQREQEYRNGLAQQRIAAYQAHIDSQRIQISIDNAASEARDAAFDARMAADRAEFSR